MAFLADQAHSRGLKLGLYASAGKLTCRNFPGSDGHEKLDADTFVEWGADFVKLDACFEPSSGVSDELIATRLAANRAGARTHYAALGRTV